MRHGLTGYVKHGCRCDDCRAAKRAAEQRDAEDRDCRTCGHAFRAPRGNIAKGFGLYCSRECAAAWRYRNHRHVSRRTVRVPPDHPLANAKGRVLVYRHMLYDKIGAGPHACHWCGREIQWVVRRGAGSFTGDLVVDHLDGDMQNNEADNLVAACNDCNTVRSFVLAWERRTGLSVDALRA
jgi:hypothetical protein